MSNASAKADMAECPFCQREVEADLVAYGGKCPHCFGEIPGEEAPTDPGEAKKKAEQKAIQAKVQRGKALPILLVSMLMVIPVCGAIVIALKPAPKMPVLNLDEGEFALGDVGELVAAPQPVAVVDEPGKAPEAKNPTKKPGELLAGLDKPKIQSGTDAGNVDFGSGASEPGKIGGPRGANGGTANGLVIDPTKPIAPTKTGGDIGSGAPGIAIARREQTGVTLTDDNLIIDMVKKTVSKNLPLLKGQCYEPILKRETALEGSWLLNFTVKPNGSVADVTAVAKPGTTAHTELEACIVSKLALWKFQPIKAELPVTKSVGFRPG